MEGPVALSGAFPVGDTLHDSCSLCCGGVELLSIGPSADMMQEPIPAGEVLDDYPGMPGDNHPEDDIDDEEDLNSQEDDQPPGTGPYATLHNEGPQISAGSGGHPESCMPCTFYCFTRRGCNRGLECRFCHLSHQSKLQQRREAWKKQQREKRKSIRERVAAEGQPRRTPSGTGKGGLPIQPVMAGLNADVRGAHDHKQLASGIYKGQVDRQRAELQSRSTGEPLGPAAPSSGFGYVPSKLILTVGQDTSIRPQILAAASHFRLLAPLPHGLLLDPVRGLITGAPTAAAPACTVVVEAELKRGGFARATIDLEVIDFTRGGFVIGHMSEVEPGRFMLLLYVPEEGEDGTKRLH